MSSSNVGSHDRSDWAELKIVQARIDTDETATKGEQRNLRIKGIVLAVIAAFVLAVGVYLMVQSGGPQNLPPFIVGGCFAVIGGGIGLFTARVVYKARQQIQSDILEARKATYTTEEILQALSEETEKKQIVTALKKQTPENFALVVGKICEYFKEGVENPPSNSKDLASAIAQCAELLGSTTSEFRWNLLGQIAPDMHKELITALIPVRTPEITETEIPHLARHPETMGELYLGDAITLDRLLTIYKVMDEKGKRKLEEKVSEDYAKDTFLTNRILEHTAAPTVVDHNPNVGGNGGTNAPAARERVKSFFEKNPSVQDQIQAFDGKELAGSEAKGEFLNALLSKQDSEALNTFIYTYFKQNGNALGSILDDPDKVYAFCGHCTVFATLMSDGLTGYKDTRTLFRKDNFIHKLIVRMCKDQKGAFLKTLVQERTTYAHDRGAFMNKFIYQHLQFLAANQEFDIANNPLIQHLIDDPKVFESVMDYGRSTTGKSHFTLPVTSKFLASLLEKYISEETQRKAFVAKMPNTWVNGYYQDELNKHLNGKAE